MTQQLNKHKQSGAVLIIGLLILLLATLIGLASMNNATVQERMAANEQNSNIAFQAAESAIDAQIQLVANGDTTQLNAAQAQYEIDPPVWPVDTTYNAGISGVSTSVEIRSMGDIALSSGNSVDADESSVRLTGARFEMRSTAQVSRSGARANIIQGLEYR